MNIVKAKALKPGALVRCPADRGDLPYTGKVTFVGTNESTGSDGKPYVWINVRNPLNGRESVWPSNRLG